MSSTWIANPVFGRSWFLTQLLNRPALKHPTRNKGLRPIFFPEHLPWPAMIFKASSYSFTSMSSCLDVVTWPERASTMEWPNGFEHRSHLWVRCVHHLHTFRRVCLGDFIHFLWEKGHPKKKQIRNFKDHKMPFRLASLPSQPPTPLANIPTSQMTQHRIFPTCEARPMLLRMFESEGCFFSGGECRCKYYVENPTCFFCWIVADDECNFPQKRLQCAMLL